MKAVLEGGCHRLFVCAVMMCVAVAKPAALDAQTPPSNPARVVSAPALLPPLPPAVIDNDLSIGGADIAARKLESRMTVAVEIEGRGPFRFVVDSGADTSALGTSIQRLLGLPPTNQAMLHGMTASALVNRVFVSELKVGQSRISNLPMPVLSDQYLGAQGLLGIDALVEQRLMMDFDKRVITIEDARRPVPHLLGEIVIMAKRRRGQLILTQATANGHPVDAVIDTGSEITIGNLALRDKLMSRNLNKDWTVATTGVTGKTVDLQLGTLRELHVGSITIRDIPIAFADVPPFKVFGLEDEPALLIGTDVLQNFRRVSLDFGARKVRFQLRRCGMQVVSLGTSPVSTLTSYSSSSDTSVCGS
jgi:predicted aspartyl protease